MSAEIATIERVRSAVEELRRAGQSPTADAVIRLIGGSKRTVLTHLRALRDAGPAQDDMPTAVLEMMRPVARDIYRAGQQAESDATRTATERMSRVIADQDVQITELLAENERLESEQASLARDRDAAISELADMRSRISADTQIDATTVLSKIEKLLVQQPAQSQKDRRTITLRNNQRRD